MVRRYVGGQAYVVRAIGIADDLSDANGDSILDFKQAQDKARAHLPGADKKAGFTVRVALNEYFEKIEDKGKSSYDSRRRVEPYIDRIADIECDQLKTKALRKWLAAVADTPPRLRTRKGEKQKYRKLDNKDAEAIRRRQATANRTWTVLRAALNSAYKDDEIESASAWEKVEPFEGVDIARVRFLSHAEAQRLINASNSEFRPMVEGALATGCRYGELCRLEVQDFSFSEEKDEDGKLTGKHVGTITIRRSKSGEVRHVALAENGVELFRRLTAGRDGTDLVFHDKNGSAWTKSAQARPMREACQNAKIRPAIGFHILRHTWASLSIKAGMPLWIVAKNLGHSDVRMVTKHYGHVEQDFISKEIRKSAPQFDSGPSNIAAIG
jgi:integrase